ncbi:integrase arm-type DNA-binding domain-containing protein [Porticoccaceae bacterium]|nr:integrase arm-type DNA-binding domain-containing protein [Porticoccaceae bacterium]
MAKRTSKLQLDAIIKGKVPKRYPLGDGLYFTIKKSGAMSFGIRYQINGEPDYKGLGAYDKVNNNLGIARAKCEAYRVQIKQGIDPKIEEQKEADLKRSAKALADQLKDSTFAKYAYKHIKNLEPSWTNIKTAAQWQSSLEKYAFPVIGDTPVSDVSRTQVLAILQPIWFEKTETADRVRRRIAAILDAAISDDLRTERNPAIWRGSLHGKLPSVESVKNVKAPTEERAHASLYYADLPMFMEALKAQDGIGARALEFCILNASRTTEVLDATWGEFDLEEGIWSIPARRMKGRERHNIPLSTQSIALIKQLKPLKMSEFVFPNRSNGKSLSQAGMSSVLKRMHKIKEWKDTHGKLITVHGFRGCFKTWTTEKTDTDWLTGEMALAHKIRDKSSATYQKGQLIDKRRRLMQKYSDYACATPQSKVVSITG